MTYLPRRSCAPAHPKRGKFTCFSEVVSTRLSNSSRSSKQNSSARVPFGYESVYSLLEIPGFSIPFPQRDLGFDYLCMTWPLVEFVVRRFVERQTILH